MSPPRGSAEEILALSGAGRKLPGTRSLVETDVARLVAMLPVAVALAASGAWAAPLNAFLHAALAVLGAQLLFARLRKRRLESSGLATAAAFALLLPEGTPILHLMLGAAVGVVLGELIFGGRGWGFLNPAAVGLAFVFFSNPAAGAPAHSIAPWAAATGGVVLLVLGLAERRVILAGLATLAVVAIAAEQLGPTLWNGSVIFALVFLAADPAGVPLSRGARWLFGSLVALFASALAAEGSAVPDTRALIFALMLGGIFGPLIDSAVLAVQGLVERKEPP